MPIIASAKKRLRQTKKRQALNLVWKENYKKALSGALKKPTKKAASAAFSLLDRAGKRGLLHKNKIARLKSRLSHALKN